MIFLLPIMQKQTADLLIPATSDQGHIHDQNEHAIFLLGFIADNKCRFSMCEKTGLNLCVSFFIYNFLFFRDISL